MKVKIVSSGKSTYWYADKIGEVFKVKDSISYNSYEVTDYEEEDGRCFLVVEDCEVVENVVNNRSTPRNKYDREIVPGVFIDVYQVLRAWEVTDPCLQHLLKKALACGTRGHKDLKEDLEDILASAKRAVEMHNEWSYK